MLRNLHNSLAESHHWHMMALSEWSSSCHGPFKLLCRSQRSQKQWWLGDTSKSLFPAGIQITLFYLTSCRACHPWLLGRGTLIFMGDSLRSNLPDIQAEVPTYEVQKTEVRNVPHCFSLKISPMVGIMTPRHLLYVGKWLKVCLSHGEGQKVLPAIWEQPP